MKEQVLINKVLNSSSVKGVGYSVETEELFVEFSRNTVYKYKGISPDIWIDIYKLVLLGNDGVKSQVGKFIQDHIKGVFVYEKVDVTDCGKVFVKEE